MVPPVSVPVSVIPLEAVIVPETVKLTAVAVPVKAGLAKSALVVTAVEILLNSVSNSEPLIILFVLPVGNESLAVKLVVFV